MQFLSCKCTFISLDVHCPDNISEYLMNCRFFFVRFELISMVDFDRFFFKKKKFTVFTFDFMSIKWPIFDFFVYGSNEIADHLC